MIFGRKQIAVGNIVGKVVNAVNKRYFLLKIFNRHILAVDDQKSREALRVAKGLGQRVILGQLLNVYLGAVVGLDSG